MIEKVTCPTCGSVYEMHETRLFNTDTDTADCEVCNTILRSWNNQTTIWSAKLIERKENHK